MSAPGSVRPGDGRERLGADSDAEYEAEVRRKAARMAAARQRGDAVWRHIVHVGVLGWMFVIPVVLGAVLGQILFRWLGQRVLGIAPILAGVAIGGYVVWREVERHLHATDELTDDLIDTGADDPETETDPEPDSETRPEPGPDRVDQEGTT
ncbi:AtpZ/AtpI family protein [Haliangium sp.]|uniref:AtpZ/AtpI family protein n=1 Tax=Haliangium sp. TaxID=2663208 RepID=UPI003D12A11A